MRVVHAAAIVLAGTIGLATVAAAGNDAPTAASPTTTTVVAAPAPSTTESTEHEATMVALQMAWQDQPSVVQARACDGWWHGNPLLAIAVVEDPTMPPGFYDPKAVADWFTYTCR